MSRISFREISRGWYGVCRNNRFSEDVVGGGFTNGSLAFDSMDSIAEVKSSTRLLCRWPRLIRRWKSRVVIFRKSE